jgi:hypothetical protein
MSGEQNIVGLMILIYGSHWFLLSPMWGPFSKNLPLWLEEYSLLNYPLFLHQSQFRGSAPYYRAYLGAARHAYALPLTIYFYGNFSVLWGRKSLALFRKILVQACGPWYGSLEGEGGGGGEGNRFEPAAIRIITASAHDHKRMVLTFA